MLSLLLPSKILLSTAPGYLKIQGPHGSFLKKLGDLKCSLVENQEGARLFISGGSEQEESTALAHISRLCVGLTRGYRRRLRLRGIGFRAIVRDLTSTPGSQAFYTKTYMRKRSIAQKTEISQNKVLNLKIGFSHEFSYPLNIAQGVTIKASRVEGRSKGTVISLQGNADAILNQVAAEIRAFRYPDVYKGKGIHYDREILKLKKGKRQG